MKTTDENLKTQDNKQEESLKEKIEDSIVNSITKGLTLFIEPYTHQIKRGAISLASGTIGWVGSNLSTLKANVEDKKVTQIIVPIGIAFVAACVAIKLIKKKEKTSVVTTDVAPLINTTNENAQPGSPPNYSAITIEPQPKLFADSLASGAAVSLAR